MSSGLNGHGREVGTDHLLKARCVYAEYLFLSTSSMSKDPSQSLHGLVIGLGGCPSGLLVSLIWVQTRIPEGSSSSWLLLAQTHRMKTPLK